MRTHSPLSKKLTLMFLCFAIFLILIMAAMKYYDDRQNLRTLILAELESTAIEKEAALQRWHQNGIDQITAIANSAHFQAMVTQLIAEPLGNRAEELTQHLIDFSGVWAGPNTLFEALMVIHPKSGIVVSSTTPNDVGTYKENRNYFLKGRKHPYSGNPYYSVTLQSSTMVASAPLYNEKHGLIGVIAGRYRMEQLGNIFTRRTGLHRSDEAYLVNSSNLFITQPRNINDPAILQRGTYNQGIDQCLAGNSGHLNLPDWRGVPVIMLFRWIANSKLCLVVQIDEAEVLEKSWSVAIPALTATIVALGAAIILSLWMGRLLSRPISRLGIAAQQIAGGNYQERIEIKSQDELGDLTDSFNQMADSLEAKELKIRQNAQELEQKIQERTSQLNEAQDELIRKERLATLGQLTATVSHELRNPLGAMRPALYILQKHLPADDKRLADAFDRLDRNIDRCDHIIDELLDFTRVQNLEVQVIEFDQWLALTLDEQAVPAGTNLERNFGLGDLRLLFDPNHMRRAVINLYENAYQAIQDENPNQEISPKSQWKVSTRTIDGRAELEMFNAGRGIPEDVLPHIFEPLYSTKTFGVGLGLPTVKQILEQHSGGVEVYSEPNRGTRFVLWLPVPEDKEKVG